MTTINITAKNITIKSPLVGDIIYLTEKEYKIIGNKYVITYPKLGGNYNE